MKKIIFLAALAAITSCQLLDIEAGNNVSVDTVIDVEDFDSISDRCSMNIVYTQTAGEPSVVLTCDENLVDYYRIWVEDGTLIADTRNNVILRPKVRPVLTVSSPVINGVSVSGSGSCQAKGSLVSEGEFVLKVSGSGSIVTEGTVECQDFSSSVSGSGSVNVSGILAETAKFKGSGSGATRVDLLTAESISATLSGSGGVTLVCKDAGDIEVSISGSGSVRLSGNARSLNSHSSGSGRVNSKNLTLGR